MNVSKEKILGNIMNALEALERGKADIQYTAENGRVYVEVEGVMFNVAAGWCDYVHKWMKKPGNDVGLTTAELSECIGHIHLALGWSRTFPVQVRISMDGDSTHYTIVDEEANMARFMLSTPAQMWSSGPYAEQRWLQLHEMIEFLRAKLG